MSDDPIILDSEVTISAKFDVEEPEGVFTPTDPSTLHLIIEHPDGVEEDLDAGNPALPTSPIFRDSAGRFRAIVLADELGWWHYKFIGTGTAAAAQEGSFLVHSKLDNPDITILRTGDYEAIRSLLGVTQIDLSDDVIEQPTFLPYIESRVMDIVPDWATLLLDPVIGIRLRNAVIIGTAATLAETYMKGGTVSLVQREEPRRNWSEWARILWNRYAEALARIASTGDADDLHDMPMLVIRGPSRHQGGRPTWRDVYPPMWD